MVHRYPGWKPKLCRECSDKRRPASRTAEAPAAATGEAVTGIFTDGSCDPNPGPGGWSAVRVEGGRVVDERAGADPATTNNRMELSALIAAFQMAGLEEQVTIWTDSELCLKTITEWAPKWERAGWKGSHKNLDLVRPLLALARSRPKAELRWLRGHNGTRWNEYADRRANAARRGSD